MDDEEFIPKLSGVRSKHDSTESGRSGNQSQKNEGDLQDSGKTGETVADRAAADLSAAALAIEMTAVSSFDSLPVTNVAPNPQSFSDLVMPETKPQLSASHLDPEFGYHGGVQEPKDQPRKPPSAMPPPPPPKSVVQYNQQIADEQPSPIDSLIKQSDELDSIWALHSEPTTNEPRLNANANANANPKQPARQTPFENNTDTKILFAPDGYGAASMTPLSPQQASLELPEMTSTPDAGAFSSGTPAPDVGDRKQRSAVVRSSLYWVVKEARLVTHGAFADYEPPRPTNSDTTILKQPKRSRVTAENSVVYEEPPAAQVPPTNAPVANVPDPMVPKTSTPNTSAPNTVMPSAPVRTNPTPPSVVNAFTEGNFDPTVKVSGDQLSKNSNEPVSQAGNPDLVKPEVAVGHRPVSLSPDDKKATQEVTGERMLKPAGAKNQSDLQRTTGQRRLEQGTTSDGTIKLPIIGSVKRKTLKKQAVTLGSVLVLCIASAMVMYDTIIAGDSATKEQESGGSKDGSGQSSLNATKNDLSNDSKSSDGELSAQTAGATSNASNDASSNPITATTEDLAKAFKLEQQQNYIASMELFDKIIAIDKGENPKSLHGRGRVCTKLQLYDKALSDLETADKLDPRNVNILIDLAAVRYLRSEYIDSAKDYEHILVDHPDDVDALYGRGISYAGMGKHESAISDFERVVKLKPTYDKAYRQMCTTYLAMGQPDKAESAITHAMKSCGADADLYFSRALSRYQQGRKDASIEDYNDAIRLSPDRKEYYNDRGYVLKEVGKLDEAKRDFQTALELDPKYKLAADNLRKLRKMEKSANSGH